MNATVISDTVNIASHVESLTKSYDVPILATEETIKSLSNPARFSIQMVDDRYSLKVKLRLLLYFGLKHPGKRETFIHEKSDYISYFSWKD